MAVRRNSYYNDPGIAQAVSSIGKMFGPPDGSDMLAWTKAAQVRSEAEARAAASGRLRSTNARLADFFDLGVNDPTGQYTNADLYERAGRIAPGGDISVLDPFVYATGQNAGNTFQGVRLKEAGDTQRTQMQQQGETTRTMLAPVGAGATRFVPPSIASMFGVPETQTGVVSVNPGDRATLPDGRVIEGAPKPRSEAEVKGAILERQNPATQDAIVFGNTPVETVVTPQGPTILPRSQAVGQQPYRPLTQEEVLGAVIQSMPQSAQRARAMGSTPTTNIQTPEGPRVAYSADAVGQAPVLADRNAQLANYETPDGRTGTAVYDAGRGGWVDSQNRQILPTGSKTYTMQAQGGREALGLGKPTTANATAANNRLAEITRMEGTLDLYEGLLRGNPGAIGLPGLIRGTAQNAVQVVGDMARSFGKDAPQIQEAAAEIRKGLQGVAPELFDPSIPEAAFLQSTIAYGIARTENPSGEVSRQAYERALERVQGGYLQNTASSLAAVGASRKVLDQERKAIGVLSGGTVALRPGVPSPTGEGPGAPRRVNSLEEAMALPPGTPFVTPDGRQKVRP
ncbi:hypothetical protein [Salinarimonas soli]|uniref:Uncharacterized protein n=1 Tax=Salinarimonas soli TaxID=1638099 RepID=A0A5B2V7R4_9HYPH|nr:hypothetical protein [Salinarimonas soli]KAA2235583.1 hypothetical protein F0L46_18965 [Salinarimonas soli]